MNGKGPVDPQEIRKKAEELEEKKLERQREREEKKRAKEAKQKQELIERLVAPALMLLTALISYLLYQSSV